MEQETNMLAGVELPEDLMKTIEGEVKAIKKANPTLKKVHVIIIQGEGDDDKPYYVAYFKRPGVVGMSKFAAAAEKDKAIGAKVLANDNFIKGDRELIDNEDLFVYGLMPRILEILKTRSGKIVNL